MTNLEPHTFEWFLAGMATPLAFGLFFLFFILRGKKEESTANGEPDAADETPSMEPSIRRTGLAILIYFLLAGLIYLLLFLFSFPILSFDGIVDKKNIRHGRLKVPWTVHEIRIAGTYHEVEKGIYHSIEPRDHVSHGFFSGYYIINGVPHRAVSWIENMAFCGGILLTILLAMSVGTVLNYLHHYRRGSLRPRHGGGTVEMVKTVETAAGRNRDRNHERVRASRYRRWKKVGAGQSLAALSFRRIFSTWSGPPPLSPWIQLGPYRRDRPLPNRIRTRHNIMRLLTLLAC